MVLLSRVCVPRYPKSVAPPLLSDAPPASPTPPAPTGNSAELRYSQHCGRCRPDLTRCALQCPAMVRSGRGWGVVLHCIVLYLLHTTNRSENPIIDWVRHVKTINTTHIVKSSHCMANEHRHTLHKPTVTINTVSPSGFGHVVIFERSARAVVAPPEILDPSDFGANTKSRAKWCVFICFSSHTLSIKIFSKILLDSCVELIVLYIIFIFLSYNIKKLVTI